VNLLVDVAHTLVDPASMSVTTVGFVLARPCALIGRALFGLV